MPGSGPSTGSGRTGGRGFGAQNLRFVMSNWQIYFSGSADWLLPDRTIDRNCLAAGKEKQDSSKIFENDPFAMSLPKGGLRRPSTSSGRTGSNHHDKRTLVLRTNGLWSSGRTDSGPQDELTLVLRANGIWSFARTEFGPQDERNLVLTRILFCICSQHPRRQA